MSAARSRNGKAAWEWLWSHARKDVEGRPELALPLDVSHLTVRDLEIACGPGALSAAQRYRRGIRGIDAPWPYVAEVRNGRLWIRAQGAERPEDVIRVFYPHVA